LAVFSKHGIAVHIMQVADLVGEGMTTTKDHAAGTRTLLLLTTTTRGKGAGGGGSSTGREASGEVLLETKFQGNVEPFTLGPFRVGGGYETAGGELVAAAAVKQRVICGAGRVR